MSQRSEIRRNIKVGLRETSGRRCGFGIVSFDFHQDVQVEADPNGKIHDLKQVLNAIGSKMRQGKYRTKNKTKNEAEWK